MDKTRLELKVGVFIVGAVIIFTVFIFKISNLRGYGIGYPLKITFGNVSGVKSGSPVRFAGVDVGEVRSVNILNIQQSGKTQIEVSAWIKKSSLIPHGSQAYVNTLGLLGEKYIEIVPPVQATSFLKSGDIIVGTDPIMLQHWVDEGEKIFQDLQEIVDKLNSKQGTVGRLLYDDKLYKELEALVTDLRRHPWKLFWKTKEKK